MTMIKYSPEEALINILHDLTNILRSERVIKITPVGSVVLGTYVGIPDIDIMIESEKGMGMHGTMGSLQRAYPNGHRKVGELLIWHVPKLYGYPVDFVVFTKDEPKTQTLLHAEYFQKVLTDDMRERVKELKQFFKDINCYGAETGGITGVCITRMAELFSTTKAALYDLFHCLVAWDRYYVSDPVIDERNLFASVLPFKRKKMIRPILWYHKDDKRTIIDLNYFFDNYERIYRIRRKKSMGTDREFQFVYSAIRKTWKNMKNRIKWWNPKIDYDILFDEKNIYVGVTIVPKELTKRAVEKIPIAVLNEKAFEKLKKLGAEYNSDLSYLKYWRKPPYKSPLKEFEKSLYTRLSEEYIELERL